MTLSPSETCRKVADIIDYENSRFNVGNWEQNDSVCGTTACIAGDTALLHNDGKEQHQDHVCAFVNIYGREQENFWTDDEWVARQGQRLGLTEKAANAMFDPVSHFWKRHNENRLDHRFSQILRQLEKELEDSKDGSLIDENKLDRIAEEALL